MSSALCRLPATPKRTGELQWPIRMSVRRQCGSQRARCCSQWRDTDPAPRTSHTVHCHQSFPWPAASAGRAVLCVCVAVAPLPGLCLSESLRLWFLRVGSHACRLQPS